MSYITYKRHLSGGKKERKKEKKREPAQTEFEQSVFALWRALQATGLMGGLEPEASEGPWAGAESRASVRG